ncbi:MAG: glutamate--cysteine ligase [Halobacteriovoraceae bacterium]|nr:glutamate--cysteine ligase [Halobacteriovoraceae bacterium]
MAHITSKQMLEEFVLSNWNCINKHIDKLMEKTPPPLYTSVDIREGHEKFAPVDNNLFPAGFNNLCQRDLDNASLVFANIFEKQNIKVVGIYPESNTRNLFYLDHLAILGKTIRDAGVEVYFLTLDETLFEDNDQIVLTSQSKYSLTFHLANVVENRLKIKAAHKIDLCILNNDQSKKIGIHLEDLDTKICPHPELGWYNREKSIHFELYSQVLEEFCKEFSIDPNLMQAKFKAVHDVDFSEKEGLELLATQVDNLKKEIDTMQSVFIKANKGTYGMGISVVESGQEILDLNRKGRNKMDIGKNNLKFTSIIAQEGVETIIKYDSMPAEITIYLVNGQSVGGFMRANNQKDARSNLNSKGMVFKKFCISEIKENQDHNIKEALYSIIARLSTLAAGHEIKRFGAE